jgi:hypothetical protein
VFRKVFGDLEAKGAGITEHQIRKQMEELMGEAQQQIMKEVPKD